MPKIDMPRIGSVVPDESPVEPEEAISETLAAFKKRRKDEAARIDNALDSEYWFAVCFLSREQKEAFLKALGWDSQGDKYLDGTLIAEKLGIVLPTVDLRFVKAKPDKRLNELSRELQSE
jgi:hypothetical protein